MVGDAAMARVVFMGSCPFALCILQALIKEFSVVGVFTAPPKPKGRGHIVHPTCVHDYADSVGIPVFTPSTFRHEDGVNDLKALKPDVAVVASYGLLLPQRVLDIPVLGCVNVHPSILPRWRGASPLVQPLLAGDGETGVAIMVMDAGMDTGPVLQQTRVLIPPRTTTAALTQMLAQQGAEVLCQVLPPYLSGHVHPIPQSTDGITYAPKITKEMGQLDWSNSAWTLLRKIDALQPWPGTFGVIGGQIIGFLQADAVGGRVPIDQNNDPDDTRCVQTKDVEGGDGTSNPSKDASSPGGTIDQTAGDNQGRFSNGCSGSDSDNGGIYSNNRADGTEDKDLLEMTGFAPGTVVRWKKSWAVVCGQETLFVPQTIRSANGKSMDARAFLQGHREVLSL